jgi:hypothetical protein
VLDAGHPGYSVVDKKGIIGKKWRAEEERNKGSLTNKLPPSGESRSHDPYASKRRWHPLSRSRSQGPIILFLYIFTKKFNKNWHFLLETKKNNAKIFYYNLGF